MVDLVDRTIVEVPLAIAAVSRPADMAPVWRIVDAVGLKIEADGLQLAAEMPVPDGAVRRAAIAAEGETPVVDVGRRVDRPGKRVQEHGLVRRVAIGTIAPGDDVAGVAVVVPAAAVRSRNMRLVQSIGRVEGEVRQVVDAVLRIVGVKDQVVAVGGQGVAKRWSRSQENQRNYRRKLLHNQIPSIENPGEPGAGPRSLIRNPSA